MLRYAVTILLSAFLLFQVQPLIGKFILPWFGGTPAVWTTCMLFFQVVLLLGYSYAHGLARFPPRKAQALIHALLLFASLLLLPVGPAAESWKPTGDEMPIGSILALLSVTIGLPYFLLSSTGPLLQEGFRRETGRTPYRLYALSNMGSLLALVTYPFLFEPQLTLHHQLVGWSAGYGLFVPLCVVRLGTGTPLGSTRGKRRTAAVGGSGIRAAHGAGCRPVAGAGDLWLGNAVGHDQPVVPRSIERTLLVGLAAGHLPAHVHHLLRWRTLVSSWSVSRAAGRRGHHRMLCAAARQSDGLVVAGAHL